MGEGEYGLAQGAWPGRVVKSRVLWRLFYLAPGVAGWGWLGVVCSPTSWASALSMTVLVPSCGGGVYACSCSIGACMSMAE